MKKLYEEEDFMQMMQNSDDQSSQPFQRRKQQLVAKLARLVPGATRYWSYLIALRAEPATVPEAARNPSNCELRLVDSSERTLYWVTSVEEATCLGARHTVRAV